MTLGAGAVSLLLDGLTVPQKAEAWRPEPFTTGRTLISRYATDPQDPWAVAHGIRAMGKGFLLKDRQPAVVHLLTREVRLRELAGQRWPHFPLEVEVHPNMFLKTVLEAGVPLAQPVVAEGRKFTLRDLLTGAKLAFSFDPATFPPNDLAWSLIAFANTTPPDPGSWVNVHGQRVEMREVVAFGFRTMEEASAPVEQAYRAGRPLTEKAPIHSFTCGGTHLLYSLCTAVNAGYREGRQAERLESQLDLLTYRLQADVDLIDRFYAGVAQHPQAPWFHLDSELKLVGHGFEVLHYALRHRLFAPTANQEERMTAAWARLQKTLAKVEGMDLTLIKTQSPKLFQQFVGDTCHLEHARHLL